MTLPYEGLPLAEIERLKLLLAGAAALLLWSRHRGAAWLTPPIWRGLLTGLTALAVLVYVNFGAFHGQRTFLHLHDLAHYYLGSKYLAELGPNDLYPAMLRAEAEWTGDRFRAIEARDLETDRLVHIRRLLRRSGPIKARFDPQRWADFQQDAALFRNTLGVHYGDVLRDHGFNATPGWALIGSPVAQLVPAGSRAGLIAIALLDPVIAAATLGAIGWAFGVEAVLLAVLYLCLVFGAGFAWIGGSFLRTPWLATLIGAVCCLQRRRHAAAGALLAVSAGLRIFPALFALPLLAKAVVEFRRTGVLPRSSLALFAGVLAAAGTLLAASALLPRGWGHWSEVSMRLSVQTEVLSPNLLGLTQMLAYRPDTGLVTSEELQAIRSRRADIHRVQLWAVALPLAILILRRVPKQSELGALLAAIPLIFASLSLASYYSGMLVLLVLVHHDRPKLLSLLFGLEAASYALSLFEPSQALMHTLRSTLIAALCGLLLFHPEWQHVDREDVATRITRA